MGSLFKYLLVFVFILNQCLAFTNNYNLFDENITPSTLTNPTTCGLALPIDDDNCPIGNSFCINVANAPGSILGTDVILQSVNIIIDHDWEQDLEITLSAPNGNSIVLTSDNEIVGFDGYGDANLTDCSATANFVHPSGCQAINITCLLYTSPSPRD